jgi:protein-disulfide isomerase
MLQVTRHTRHRIGAALAQCLACLSILLAPPSFGAATKDLEADFAQHLLKDPESPVLGNPDGTVSIVEFFDYRCPYCKDMEPTLAKLLAQDQSVRLVEKDWPVFGGISVYAAEVALAARWQGKYPQVHAALFAVPGEMDREAVRKAAQSAGLDLARLDRDTAARRAEIDSILSMTDDEAHLLHLQGTPVFVIGPYVIPGVLSAEKLAEIVRKAKGGK